MLTLNLSAILENLKKKNFQASFQEETNQLLVIIKADKYEFPVFIRVDDESDLLQLITFIPKNYQRGTEGDLARLLHLFNKEIDLPGFGMNEETAHIFYRCTIPSVKRKFEEEVLEAFLNSIQTVCQTFLMPILAVAEGKISYDELIKRAREEGIQS